MKLASAYLLAAVVLLATLLVSMMGSSSNGNNNNLFVASQSSDPGIGDQTRYKIKGDADLFNVRTMLSSNLQVLQSKLRIAATQVYNAAKAYPALLTGESNADVLTNTKDFLTQLSSVQFDNAFMINLNYAYIIKYQCHDDNHTSGGSKTAHCHWTEAGATFGAATTAQYTYLTDADGKFRDYKGFNYNTPDSISDGGYVEGEQYVKELSAFTAADQNGKFLNAYYYFSPTLKKSLALITLGMPLTFDKDGKATSVVAIDISMDALTSFLNIGQGSTGDNAEGIAIDARNPQIWKFIAGTHQVAFNGTGYSSQDYPFDATQTTNARINAFSTTLRSKLGTTIISSLAPGTDMQPTSIDGGDGFTYTAVSFYGSFLIAVRYPQSLLGAKSASTILSSMFNTVVTWTRAVSLYFFQTASSNLLPSGQTSFQSMSEAFDSPDAMSRMKPLIDALGGMTLAARGMIRYAYFSYKVNDNSGRWGDLWTEYLQDTSNADAPPYYGASFTATNGTRYDWVGKGPYTSYPFTQITPNSSVEGEDYIQFVMNLTSANQSGVFQQPQSWTDPVTKQTTKLITFTVPILFDGDGKCAFAFSVDIDIDWLQSATKLHIETHESTSPDNLISMIWAKTDQFVFDTNKDNANWKNSFPNVFGSDISTNLKKNYFNIYESSGGLKEAKKSRVSFACTQANCPAQYGAPGSYRSLDSIVNVEVVANPNTRDKNLKNLFYIVEQVPLDVLQKPDGSSYSVNSKFPGSPMMMQTIRDARATMVTAQFLAMNLNNMLNGFYAGLNTACSLWGDAAYGRIVEGFYALMTTVAAVGGLPVNAIRIVASDQNQNIGVCGIFATQDDDGEPDFAKYYTSFDRKNFYIDGQLKNDNKGTVFTNSSVQWADLVKAGFVYDHDKWYPTPYRMQNPAGRYQGAFNVQVASVVQGPVFDYLWAAKPADVPTFNQKMGAMYAIDYTLTTFKNGKAQSTLFGDTGLLMTSSVPPVNLGDAFVTDVWGNSYVGGVNAATFFNPNDASTFTPPTVTTTPIKRLNTMGTIVTKEINQAAANFLSGNEKTLDIVFYLNDGFNYYVEQCWFWTIVVRTPVVATPTIANVMIGNEQARASAMISASTTHYSNLGGNVRFWDPTDPNALILMRSMEATLLSFGGKAVYNYFSYQMPGGKKDKNGEPMWGDFGCQLLTDANPNGGLVNCMLVDDNLTRYDWYGSNISGTPYSTTKFENTAYYDYTIVISRTPKNVATNVWHKPSSYTDPVTKQTDMLATMTTGIAFSTTSPYNITTGMSIDFNLKALNTDLDAAKSSSDEMVVLMWHDNMVISPQLIAAADSATGAKLGTSSWATGTKTSANSFVYDMFHWAVANINTGVTGVFSGWRLPISVYSTAQGLLNVQAFPSLQMDTSGTISGSFYNWATFSQLPAGSPALSGGAQLGDTGKSKFPPGAIAGAVIGGALVVSVVAFVVLKKKGTAGGSESNHQQFVAYQNAELQSNNQV